MTFLMRRCPCCRVAIPDIDSGEVLIVTVRTIPGNQFRDRFLPAQMRFKDDGYTGIAFDPMVECYSTNLRKLTLVCRRRRGANSATLANFQLGDL